MRSTLASKDAWSALDHGALLRSSEILGGGAIDRQERQGSVWWPAVVGAINLDGLIVLGVAIELLARR
jgi:hypothetical protein